MSLSLRMWAKCLISSAVRSGCQRFGSGLADYREPAPVGLTTITTSPPILPGVAPWKSPRSCLPEWFSPTSKLFAENFWRSTAKRVVRPMRRLKGNQPRLLRGGDSELVAWGGGRRFPATSAHGGPGSRFVPGFPVAGFLHIVLKGRRCVFSPLFTRLQAANKMRQVHLLLASAWRSAHRRSDTGRSRLAPRGRGRRSHAVWTTSAYRRFSATGRWRLNGCSLARKAINCSGH
jgi:hypothetical protein